MEEGSELVARLTDKNHGPAAADYFNAVPHGPITWKSISTI